MQLLGQLYPQMPGKKQAALVQFQEAARKNTSSAGVWQILGELLSPVDAQGMRQSSPAASSRTASPLCCVNALLYAVLRAAMQPYTRRKRPTCSADRATQGSRGVQRR